MSLDCVLGGYLFLRPWQMENHPFRKKNKPHINANNIKNITMRLPLILIFLIILYYSFILI